LFGMLLENIRVDSKTHRLSAGSLHTPCALGRSGVCHALHKREGDGATPLGRYALAWIYWRADRLAPFPCLLPSQPLHPDDGWCDAPDDPAYNRPVRHPYGASAEKLWRADGLYDILITLGHNTNPVVPGLGSAIFIHCALNDAHGSLKPTLGCIALPKPALITLLGQLRAGAWIEII
jgi:L,D-peptidoglycan transpeptidase YkuD (ErfK/YbiS/YcfS/YnhG family)